MSILLPHERLPSGRTERHALLRNYFCDKDADAVWTPLGWKLDLGWPDDEDRYVDPALEVGLSWWGGGVCRKTMAFARQREGRVLRSLYDTWTLQSWCDWLFRRGVAAIENLVILHVDDHKDLGSPRLFRHHESWTDPMTGAVCDLLKPGSVQSAIESGALGMGSFLTQFLHLAPDTEVRHLCQPPKAKSTMDYRYLRVVEPDSLLEPGRSRPAISLSQTQGSIGPGTYRITPKLDDWLEGIRPGPVLLHIDMDYFNNRYDGDSDWEARPEILNPSIEEICVKIDEMTDSLLTSKVLGRIEDVVIAYSPGFFPAEFWNVSDTRIRRNLNKMYDQ